ncbi:sensor N-terminal transmembrane domain-containing protein [Siccirubricoccus deserti]
MPDVGVPSDQKQSAGGQQRRRWVSPLLRRILLLNALPPALLAAAMLYLDQYQNGLLAAEVEAMRTQARIYAGAIAEAATRLQDDRAMLVPEAARPLLRRLVDPPRTPRPSCSTTPAWSSPTAGCGKAPAAPWSPSRCRRRSRAAPSRPASAVSTTRC